MPIIANSPAYKEDGLLVINFDEGEFTTSVGPDRWDDHLPGPILLQRAARTERRNLFAVPERRRFYPRLRQLRRRTHRRSSTLAVPQTRTVSEIPCNHYSFLKTLEDIYETKNYLGYAAQPGLQGFFGCVNSEIKTRTGDQFGSCH